MSTTKTTTGSTRRLFVKAGARDVVLNWIGPPELEVDLVAGEYFEAARALVRRYEQAGHKDLAAYPILALYRHAMELFLKSLLILGGRFTGRLFDADTEEALKKHFLPPLLNSADRLFADLGMNTWVRILAETEFREVIQELDRIDTDGQAFRYTLKKNGSPTVERNFTFSIKYVADILDPILNRLSSACLGLREHYRNVP